MFYQRNFAPNEGQYELQVPTQFPKKSLRGRSTPDLWRDCGWDCFLGIEWQGDDYEAARYCRKEGRKRE